MENLPEELIYSICENLDDRELNRFMQASKQNQRVCNSILERRKQGERFSDYKRKMEFLDTLHKFLHFDLDAVNVLKIQIIPDSYPISKPIYVEYYLRDKLLHYYRGMNETVTLEQAKRNLAFNPVHPDQIYEDIKALIKDFSIDELLYSIDIRATNFI